MVNSPSCKFAPGLSSDSLFNTVVLLSELSLPKFVIEIMSANFVNSLGGGKGVRVNSTFTVPVYDADPGFAESVAEMLVTLEKLS
jgi:hypothetical protein